MRSILINEPDNIAGSRAFLSLSGGVDSTTVYSILDDFGARVTPVFFRYPSKHNAMEEQAATRVADHFVRIKKGHDVLRIIDTTPLFAYTKSHLLKDGPEIPAEDYSFENARRTVVPGRNTIFIAALASFAGSVEGDVVFLALGMQGGDFAVYADCRPEYVESVARTIDLSSEGKIKVIAPIVDLRKGDVVKVGRMLGTPYEITRSCYNGTDKPCMVCPTCRAREEAFIEAGIVDPLLA